MADTYDFSLDFSYDDVTKGLADITQHGKQVLDVFLKMADQIAAATTKVGQGGRQAADPLAAVGKAAEQVLKGVTKNLQDIDKQIRQQDMSPLAKQADNYAQKIIAAQNAVAGLQSKINSLKTSEEEREVLTTKLELAQQRLNDTIKRQESLAGMAKLKDDTKAAEIAAKSAEAAYKQLGQSVMDVAGNVRNASAVVASTLSLGIGASAKTFMDFSDQLQTFKAVAHASGDEVAYMAEKAKGLEGIPTTQAAAASVELARAGLTAREAADDLTIMSKAAIASGEDLSTVSKIMLSTNRAFGQSNSELAKTTDVITAAANATSTSVAEVGAGMSTMASTAASTHQTLLDTAIAFGILRDAGVEVGPAATGYRSAMLMMLAPTKQARDELNLLTKSQNGVKEIFQENGHVRAFADVMKDLKERLSGLSEAARGEVLAKIFDKKGINVVLAYMKQTDEKIAATTKEIRNFDGTAERTAKTMQDSMGAEFRAMLKDIENLKIEFAEKMSPTLRDFIKIISDLMESYGHLSGTMKTFISQGVLVVAGASALMSIFAQLVLSVGGVIFAYNGLVAAGTKVIAQNGLVEASSSGLNKALIGMSGGAGGLAMFSLGLGAIVLAGLEVIHQIEELNKALEGLDENLGILDSVQQKTSGALSAALRAQREGKPLTKEQADAADVNTRNMINGYKEEIQTLTSLWKDYEKAKKSAELGDGSGSGAVDALEEKLKAYGVKDVSDLNRILRSYQNRINKLQGTHTEVESLQAGSAFSASGLDAIKKGAPAPGAPKLTDGDVEGAGKDSKNRDVKELQQFITALDATTDHQIANDKKAIASSKQVQDSLKNTSDGYQHVADNAKKWIETGGALQYALKDSSGWFAQGIGCANLTKEFLRLGGVSDKVLAQMNDRVDSTIANLKHAKMVTEVSAKDARAGDLVTAADESHIGLYLGGGKMAAASNEEGKRTYSQYHRGQIPVVQNQWMRGARYYRVNQEFMGAGGAPSKEELAAAQKSLESQAAAKRIQEEINILVAKRGEIEAGNSKKKDDMLATIDSVIERKRGELDTAQKNGIEALNKLKADRIKDEQQAQDQIAQMEARHQAAKIAIMEEGYGKIEAMRQADLDASNAEKEKALRDFKGNQGQLQDLLAQFNQQEKDINARHDKEKTELAERYARELRSLNDTVESNRINAMREGLAKQMALLELQTKQQLDLIKDQEDKLIKEKRKGGDEWNALEKQKTQILKQESTQRSEIEFNARANTLERYKQLLASQQTEDQKAFDSAIQNYVSAKKKLGLSTDQMRAALKPEDFMNLAGALGQGDLQGAISNLNLQSMQAHSSMMLEQERQKNPKLSDEERTKSQITFNQAKQEEARLMSMIALLSDTSTRDMIQKYQKLLPLVQNINDEHLKFQSIITSVSQVAQGFAGTFGEAGRNIASGIGVAANALNTAEGLITKFNKLADSPTKMADFFGDLSNVGDVVGLIATGVGLVGQLVTGLANANAQTQAAIQKATNAALDYNSDRAVAEAQRRVDDIKRQGMDSSDAEIALSNARAAAEKSKLARNNQELIQYAYNAVSPYAKDKSVAGARSIYDSGKLNVLSGDPRGAELIGLFSQSDKIDEDNAKNQADIRKASFEKRAKDLQVLESKYSEYMLTLAKTGNDKLVLADAEAEAQKLAIRHKYDAEFKDATDKHIEDQSDIMARYYAEMALADKEAAQKRRDINAENAKFEIDAMTKHEQSKIGLMQDGYQKDRALAVSARDAEQKNFTADMMRYEKHTKEYSALAQQKADALEAANERIRKSDEANALARTKDLNAMKAATAQALAAMTESGLDDIAVQRQTALADLVVAEGEERKKAIANYGEDQEILNGISAKYAALRAKNNRDTEKQALESVRKDYETMQQQILTGQLHPLQMILDKENDRVRALQRANEELQHSLDLIDKRYAKENKAQDLADRAQFDALKGGGISLADLTAGANEIANEDIINGKVTDRSSKATQLRGLKLLLARQAQDAETKRKNEGYDSTNSDLNEQGFAADMARILGRQAAVVEAAKAEAKTAKEKSDLDAEGADLYVKYQQLQKDALAAKQRVEQQGIRDQMDANSALIDQGWDTVTQTKRQMEDLQTAYDVKMKGVSDAFAVAGNSSDVLLAKLKQWAPALAASAQAAVASIKTVTNALNTPIPTVGGNSGSGSGSGAYVGPSRVSTPTPGYIVTDGTYWYKNTSDMYAASATHMASGGVVPPGFEGDNFPAFLKTGERVLTPEMNQHFEGMMSRFALPMPVPSYTHMGDQHIHIGNISRDVDLNKLDEVLNRRDFRNRGQNMSRYGGTGLSRN